MTNDHSIIRVLLKYQESLKPLCLVVVLIWSDASAGTDERKNQVQFYSHAMYL